MLIRAVLILFFAVFLHGDIDKWGVGYVVTKTRESLRDDISACVEMLCLPQKLSLYDKSFKKVGVLEKLSEFGGKITMCKKERLFGYPTTDEEMKIYEDMYLISDFEQIGYSGYALMVYSQNGDFLRVLKNSFKEKIYIKKSELKNANFQYIDMKTFLLNQDAMFGVMEQTPLYKSFDKKEILTTLKPEKDDYMLEFTGISKGKLAQVIVTLYSHDICSGDQKELKKLKGWIYIFNSSNIPTIWFTPKGC